jgi:hypothetical protein
MYEIVCLMGHIEEVMETVDSLETAQLTVLRYITRGFAAHYRTKVRRAA